MAAFFAKLRSWLVDHPTYSTALGLAVSALGMYLAGNKDGAVTALEAALGVLGVKVAAKAMAPTAKAPQAK